MHKIMKIIRQHFVKILLAILLSIGFAKFYHYNYIANTKGQARALRLSGFREFVCKGVRFSSGSIDQCGYRSIYKDSDWGITAYFTVYGVETKEEAEAIADFMIDARRASNQAHIPINLEVYSTPRSSTSSRPSRYLILDKTF